MSITETRRILVTVKAYPNPSTKYGETVCCAGIDIETYQWIRLYPIPFRDLDESQRFRKYSIIEVRCNKACDDHRVESYKVDSDTINKVNYLGTQDKWNSRKAIVLRAVSPSFCHILEATSQNSSLGMFKPSTIDFTWQKADLQNETKRKSCYTQMTFFDKAKNVIEQIPFDFYYHFTCHGKPDCPGHKLPIIDWEIGQAYRSWRFNYKTTQLLLDKIKEQWLGRLCAEKNDVYFYVGNMKRFHDKFMILGVFYPPL